MTQHMGPAGKRIPCSAQYRFRQSLDGEFQLPPLGCRTRVRCGDRALGYTLFHGVWEWFYEKVVFFF